MLPDRLTREQFDAALAAFRTVVGTDWVLTGADDLETYRDFYSPFWDSPDELRASVAIAPASVEQVQQIVRIANRYHVPLYPISTGKNLGYGGAAPTQSGSVVLDLKRMNRILEVDEQRQFVLVEPGVSYFDLYKHIRDKGLKLWIDCPDPGWGSLIGNALDHGLGYTSAPVRDHFGAHCGMEVVLPDGELIRTGMGARAGTETWQDFRYGIGPYADGLFSQSNFGVVTKMGFWLYPQPEGYLAGDVIVPRYHDIIPMTEILNELQNVGLVTAMPHIASPVLAPMVRPPDQQTLTVVTREESSAADFAAVAQGKPYWKLRIGFYDPPAVAEAKWDYAKQRFSAIPDVRFDDVRRYSFPLSDQQIAALSADFEADRRATFGIPSLEAFRIGARSAFNPTPSHGHLWLSPAIPKTGQALIEAQRILTRAMIELGIPVAVGVPIPLLMSPRAFLLIIPFFISDDPQQNRQTRANMARLIDLAAQHGWLEYRTHPAFQEQVVSLYDFNDRALLRLHEKLKDALDPNGILSPGRYAIRPRAQRKRNA